MKQCAFDEILPLDELLVKEDKKYTDEFSAHKSSSQFPFNTGGIVIVNQNTMNLLI